MGEVLPALTVTSPRWQFTLWVTLGHKFLFTYMFLTWVTIRSQSTSPLFIAPTRKGMNGIQYTE